MSTDLILIAFDFDKIDSWKSSQDVEFHRAALNFLQNLIDENASSSSNHKMQQQIIAEAKIRLSDFFEQTTDQIKTEETAADILCAKALAFAGKAKAQPWLNENDTAQNYEEARWSQPNLLKLSRQFEQKFEPSLNILFDYLIYGRGFSGRAIASGAGLYAYLTRVEIEEMIILLTRHYEEALDLIDRGAFCKIDFESSMVDVIESMLLTLKQASEHDLFIVAS
jgi:hypothetical protein